MGVCERKLAAPNEVRKVRSEGMIIRNGGDIILCFFGR